MYKFFVFTLKYIAYMLAFAICLLYPLYKTGLDNKDLIEGDEKIADISDIRSIRLEIKAHETAIQRLMQGMDELLEVSMSRPVKGQKDYRSTSSGSHSFCRRCTAMSSIFSCLCVFCGHKKRAGRNSPPSSHIFMCCSAV